MKFAVILCACLAFSLNVGTAQYVAASPAAAAGVLKPILSGIASDSETLAEGGKLIANLVRNTDPELIRSLTKQFGCALPVYNREATAQFIENGALFLAGKAPAAPNLVQPVVAAGVPIINKSVGK